MSMIFTDDELRQLKIDLGLYNEDLVYRIWALLNRLEAAEKVCKDVEPIVDHYAFKSWYKWRKACGK